MNIAIIQESIDPKRGGAETSTLEMAARLAELGPHVCVVHGGGETPVEIAAARPMLEFAGLRSDSASRFWRARRFVAAVDEFLKQRRFDIVHSVVPVRSCDVYQPRGGTYGEMIRRSLALSRSPWARSLRAMGRRLNLRQQYLLRVEAAMLNSPKPPMVACLSEYVRRQVRFDFPDFPAERTRIVLNGVDVAPLNDDERSNRAARFRAEHQLAADTPVIAFIAHHFKLKGLRELIAACALPAVRASGAICLVAGRGDASSYERQALALGIAGRIRFLGSGSSIRDLLAATDVLAHPTWYDPCSRVVLEALLLGVPVVTTVWNGASDVITPEVGRVIDSPGNVPELAAAIVQMLGFEPRWATRAAEERLGAVISMRRHAKALMSLYELVQESRR
ncbi:MAG: glycosyltransferase family 4 protein [Phycisphaerae bacterium]